jgi:hypothetical protein
MSKKKFPRGWSGGWDDYRYGEKRPVYNPAKPAIRPDPGKVRQVAEAVTHWQLNRWEHEATVRRIVRSERIAATEGPKWDDVDAYAAAVVHKAYVALGRGPETRPRKEEGQPEFTTSPEFCVGCLGPLDDDDIANRRRFCCVECARKVLARREYSKADRAEDKLGLAAYIEIERSRNAPRCCVQCDEEFRPRYPGDPQKYCSKRCQDQAHVKYDDRACKSCGKTFRPRKDSQLFCSIKCRCTARSDWAIEHVCAWCHGPFNAPSFTAKYCGPACMQEAASFRKAGRMRFTLTAPTFDHCFDVGRSKSRRWYGGNH